MHIYRVNEKFKTSHVGIYLKFCRPEFSYIVNYIIKICFRQFIFMKLKREVLVSRLMVIKCCYAGVCHTLLLSVAIQKVLLMMLLGKFFNITLTIYLRKNYE